MKNAKTVEVDLGKDSIKGPLGSLNSHNYFGEVSKSPQAGFMNKAYKPGEAVTVQLKCGADVWCAGKVIEKVSQEHDRKPDRSDSDVIDKIEEAVTTASSKLGEVSRGAKAIQLPSSDCAPCTQ